MCKGHEYRFVLILGVIALAITSIPYGLGAGMTNEERIFGGFVYAVEDCYSYLAKMRQGADGAWLFHIAYTPEPHPGALFFLFHLLLGKLAAGAGFLLPAAPLTLRMVWIYHLARWIFGLSLLFTVYRFLAAFSKRLMVRRLAWTMVTFGGGLGWLLVFLGRPGWLGSLPLDFILPEGFTFLVLYAFPHIALGRTLLLWGVLSLRRAWGLNPASDQQDRPRTRPILARLGPVSWAVITGLLWLMMGLIVPFYVAVAWAITGASLIALVLRQSRRVLHRSALASVSGLISSPIVLYSAWRFTSDPVYEAWATQNRILSPHPLHYFIAYGVLLIPAIFAVRDARSEERPTWLALAWVGIVPLLIYLPFNLQRRLVEGVQVPLSLLAAMGLTRIFNLNAGGSSLRSNLGIGIVLLTLFPTNGMVITGGIQSLQGRPDPIFRDREEIIALDWLGQQASPSDVVLASYKTGNYLPARVRARAFVGHGPESVNTDQKKDQAAHFFSTTTDDGWRERFLRDYAIAYVFWGPAERRLGGFDPTEASYLHEIYTVEEYVVFTVEL